MSGETIYTWIKPDPQAPEKAPLYHAKAAWDAPLVGSTIKVGAKKTHGHMGMTRAQMMATIQPENFLRAHQNSGWVDTNSMPEPHHKTLSKVPPVPKQSELPPRIAKEYKDFVTENAIQAITMKPRPKVEQLPKWVPKNGQNYNGVAPPYLARVKAEIEAEREYILQLLDQQQMEEEAAAGSTTRELDDDERADLLDALKTKWDAVNSKYQIIAHRKISSSTASLGEIRWKEDCERQMSKLEADIKRISMPGPIYVVADHR